MHRVEAAVSNYITFCDCICCKSSFPVWHASVLSNAVIQTQELPYQAQNILSCLSVMLFLFLMI